MCHKKSISGAIAHTKISSNQLLMLNRMVKTSNERSARELKIDKVRLRASSRTVQKYINMMNWGKKKDSLLSICENEESD